MKNFSVITIDETKPKTVQIPVQMTVTNGNKPKTVQMPVQMKVTQVQPQPRNIGTSNVRLTFPVNRVLRSTENIKKPPEVRIVYQKKN